jgi:hypothetical protein
MNVVKTAVFTLMTVCAAVPAIAQDDVTTYQAETDFADVAADLNDAIINRGYVVDHRGQIGEMLERTAGDVGATKSLYRNAEFFQFCSAVMSRMVMEQSLANIAYCPYVIFAYEAEEAPGTVVVGFRRLPRGEGRDAVNTMLEEITREAAGEE